MAAIQKVGNFLTLFNDDNRVVASREIPTSGKTLQIKFQLLAIADTHGLKVRA